MLICIRYVTVNFRMHNWLVELSDKFISFHGLPLLEFAVTFVDCDIFVILILYCYFERLEQLIDIL